MNTNNFVLKEKWKKITREKRNPIYTIFKNKGSSVSDSYSEIS